VEERQDQSLAHDLIDQIHPRELACNGEGVFLRELPEEEDSKSGVQGWTEPEQEQSGIKAKVQKPEGTQSVSQTKFHLFDCKENAKPPPQRKLGRGLRALLKGSLSCNTMITQTKRDCQGKNLRQKYEPPRHKFGAEVFRRRWGTTQPSKEHIVQREMIRVD